MTTAERNFSDALATWRDINLSDLQKTLDVQGVEIVENQKESVVGRKGLAERTKDFRKLPDDEKLESWKGLLKSYQTEIDNLTKRSKVSENAFLNLYKKIAEAPDPYPLLDAAVEQAIKASQSSELESELMKLREENTTLSCKVTELSGADAARKKAESRVQQLEDKIQEAITERVTQKENELNATYDEKLRNYADREQDLIRQLALSKTQLRDLRTSNESNQAKLLDQSQRQDQETIAKLSELDMIVAELERANNRVSSVERRNELLRVEIESIRSGNDSTTKIAALESRVSELSSESDRLLRALEAQKLSSSEVEHMLTERVQEKAKEASKWGSEVENLKQKLQRYSDYDEVKRELEIMKYVEFTGLDEDEGNIASGYMAGNELGLSLPNPNAEKANAEQNKSLEALLAAKNMRIMEELTKYRILHGELEGSLRKASDELLATKAELDRHKALNDKLETDLLQVQSQPSHGSGFRTPAENGTPVKDGLSNLDLGNRKGGSDSPARSTPISFHASTDTSILPVVTSQRDRFRQRNGELEEELKKQFQVISELRTEVKTLQSDNLKLYEKVRYMHSYKEDNATLNPLPAARHDDLSKYHARYEEAMNPFEAFRGREASRAFQALNPIEKAVLTLTRAILGNRRARNIFIFYAFALHLLVMFTTYECTLSSGTSLKTQPMPYG
ncbi:hypothetical protein BD410DRAFT_783893 [Rickenella mellea]|uniref:Protein CASP n=1 Tax=Rickenella mellea TaxID=50990 RepID=A0A4Y7QGD9_9AGAM|nr:hypothetical protein BD410DRAFT_783893 [Rickenella mellea]